MRKLLFILAPFFLLFSLYSCETLTENPEEYIELELVPKGIDVSVSPMSTKGSSSDLYMVSIYKDKALNGNEYAAWLTDDLGSEKIRLLKGRKYVCCVYYFPNGKNILADYETGSCYPVCGMHLVTPKLSDGILYGTRYGYGNPISGAAKKKGDQTSGAAASGYYLNDVVRYYGRISIDATEDISADIDLYMQMVGLNITVKNLNKGKVKVYNPLNDGIENNVIYLTPSAPSIVKNVAPDTVPWYEWNESNPYDFMDFESSICITIDYIDENGKGINILELRDYPIKRMTRLNITLDLEEILSDVKASLNPNVIDDEIWSDVNLAE